MSAGSREREWTDRPRGQEGMMSEQGVALSTEQRELLERVAAHLEGDVRDRWEMKHPSWEPVRGRWREDSVALRDLARASQPAPAHVVNLPSPRVVSRCPAELGRQAELTVHATERTEQPAPADLVSCVRCGRGGVKSSMESGVPGIWYCKGAMCEKPAPAELAGEPCETCCYHTSRGHSCDGSGRKPDGSCWRPGYLSGNEPKAAPRPAALDAETADRIWSCMCGHCESWSDHGDGKGWCSEHNTTTVSGHTCKHSRPKAEYAAPAEPNPEGGDPIVSKPAPPPAAPEGECPLADKIVATACRRIAQGPPYTLRDIDPEGLLRWAEEVRALAADRAKLERECAEWRADRLGLIKQIELLGQVWGESIARAQEAEKRAEGCFRLPGNLTKPWPTYLRHLSNLPMLDDLTKADLRRLADAIERGPEGEGVWVSRAVAEELRTTPDFLARCTCTLCQWVRKVIPAEWLAPAQAEGSEA